MHFLDKEIISAKEDQKHISLEDFIGVGCHLFSLHMGLLHVTSHYFIFQSISLSAQLLFLQTAYKARAI
jgi:hypothetical protein